jgi:hypothetical protein
MGCVVLTTYLPADKFASHANVLATAPDFTHLSLESLLDEVVS